MTVSSQSTTCRQYHDINHFWKLWCAFSPCRAQTNTDSMMWSFYCHTCTIFSNLFIQVCWDSAEFPEDNILFLPGFHQSLETQNTCRIKEMSCSDDPQFFKTCTFFHTEVNYEKVHSFCHIYKCTVQFW